MVTRTEHTVVLCCSHRSKKNGLGLDHAVICPFSNHPETIISSLFHQQFHAFFLGCLASCFISSLTQSLTLAPKFRTLAEPTSLRLVLQFAIWERVHVYPTPGCRWFQFYLGTFRVSY